MHFVLNTIPFPKQSARNARGHTYIPTKTRNAINDIKKLLITHPECPSEPLCGPVSVFATFFIPIPKSWSKKRKEEELGECVYKKNFDLDNLEKTLYDACTGILWEDDGQVWQHNNKKVWSKTGKIELNVY